MLENNIPEAMDRVDKMSMKALTAIGLFVMGKAVENLRKPRKHRGGGSFPTYDTGNLANSVTFQADGKQVHIGTPAEYGIYIEKGAKAHWTSPKNLMDWCRRKLGDAKLAYPVAKVIAKQDMPAMPWLEPAFTQNISEIERIAGQEAKLVFPE